MKFLIKHKRCGYLEFTNDEKRYWKFASTVQHCPSCGVWEKINPKIVKAAKTDTPCDNLCKNAKGAVCNCSCEGANHGINHQRKEDENNKAAG